MSLKARQAIQTWPMRPRTFYFSTCASRPSDMRILFPAPFPFSLRTIMYALSIFEAVSFSVRASVEGGRARGHRARVLCCGYASCIQTLKYDNFLEKHLFLILFAPLLRSIKVDHVRYVLKQIYMIIKFCA